MLVSPHRPACQARPSAVRGPACGPWSGPWSVVLGPVRGPWSVRSRERSVGATELPCRRRPVVLPNISCAPPPPPAQLGEESDSAGAAAASVTGLADACPVAGS